MNIDELFQKINKDNYELKNHKDKLRVILLNDKYFTRKENAFSLSNFALPSLSLTLSAVIFIAAYTIIPKTIPDQVLTDNHNSTLYARLLKNNNTTTPTNDETKTLEINQENTKTILRFNNKNVLIDSKVK